MRPECFTGVVVEWDETKTVMEVIFSKNSIINALKLGIEVNWVLEVWFIGFAEVPIYHIVDGKLSFPSIVQHIEGPLNVFEPFLVNLSLEVIDEEGVVDIFVVLREFFENDMEVLLL